MDEREQASRARVLQGGSGPLGPYVVYGLVDPRDGSIHYVGQTGNLEGRLASHTSEGRRLARHPNENPRKCDWLRDVHRAGMRFGVCVLEGADTSWEICDAEARWIETGLTVGWPLTNRTPAKRKVVARLASPSHRQEVGR